jgi:hypothetical protein
MDTILRLHITPAKVRMDEPMVAKNYIASA